jgi:uncharacterized RDD family membrane protein YckC
MDSSPNDSARATQRRSTLIEFPGVSRNSMPEWRKELSERVREVQEKRARETAREAAEAERQRLAESVNPPQLELLPPAPMPTINPLVAAALKRIERAHQPAPAESRQPHTTLATAVAYAPEREENDMNETVATNEQLAFEPELPAVDSPVIAEKTIHLSVVPAAEPVVEKPVVEKIEPRPVKRLILDDLNDPALNYLDSIAKNVQVDERGKRSAPAFRRLVCASLDLIFCALFSAPIAAAIVFTGSNLKDPRVIAVLAGSAVLVTFFYLTLMTALTGRTWAMRLLSLRVIDTKTGLIPTGGQSIGRSILYLFSLASVIGLLSALLSREGFTFHDRLTRTAVVKN